MKFEHFLARRDEAFWKDLLGSKMHDRNSEERPIPLQLAPKPTNRMHEFYKTFSDSPYFVDKYLLDDVIKAMKNGGNGMKQALEAISGAGKRGAMIAIQQFLGGGGNAGIRSNQMKAASDFSSGQDGF